MSWLLSALNWLLPLIPIGDVLKAIISVLRKLALQTDTQLDDEAVNFIEMVFQEMGLISSDANPAPTLATLKVAAVPVPVPDKKGK
jgi:hypothetical protein